MSGSRLKLAPEYTTWWGMHQRCYNPNAAGYKNYGARGITVCDAWMTYSAFIRDMGLRPAGTVLDRVDSDGPYNPDNCRWVTWAVQRRNMRDIRWVNIEGGLRVTVADACRMLGLPLRTVRRWIADGMPPQEAVNKATGRMAGGNAA